MVSKPHPRAADLEMLRRLIAENGDKSIRNILTDSFQQIGDHNAAILLRHAALDPRKTGYSLSREDISRLSTALRNFDGFGRPDATCLSPLGRESFLASVKSMFPLSFCTYGQRGPSEWEGNPFIIEGVLAIGSHCAESDIPLLYRFANRVPLLYDASDDVFMKVLRKIDWSRYYSRSLHQAYVFVHLSSTRIPYRAAGKQSIALVPEIETEALALLKGVVRDLSKSTKELGHQSRNTKKMQEFAKSFRLIAKFGASLAGTDIPPTDSLIANLFEVSGDDRVE
jgi:DNA topoisomerase-6 subunit B